MRGGGGAGHLRWHYAPSYTNFSKLKFEQNSGKTGLKFVLKRPMDLYWHMVLTTDAALQRDVNYLHTLNLRDVLVEWNMERPSSMYRYHVAQYPLMMVIWHETALFSDQSVLTLTVPSLVQPIDLLHIYMPMVMRGLRHALRHATGSVVVTGDGAKTKRQLTSGSYSGWRDINQMAFKEVISTQVSSKWFKVT